MTIRDYVARVKENCYDYYKSYPYEQIVKTAVEWTLGGCITHICLSKDIKLGLTYGVIMGVGTASYKLVEPIFVAFSETPIRADGLGRAANIPHRLNIIHLSSTKNFSGKTSFYASLYPLSLITMIAGSCILFHKLR